MPFFVVCFRNVPLSEEETPQRKGSSGTIRSEGRAPHDATKVGLFSKKLILPLPW